MDFSRRMGRRISMNFDHPKFLIYVLFVSTYLIQESTRRRIDEISDLRMGKMKHKKIRNIKANSVTVMRAYTTYDSMNNNVCPSEIERRKIASNNRLM